MEPEIAIHRDVQIRYGYSICDDLFYAHFVLPQKPMRFNPMQTRVQTFMSSTLSPGKNHVTADSEQDVLLKARKEIDDYFGE